MNAARALRAALLPATIAAAGACHAGAMLRADGLLCQRPAERSAVQQDAMLRFGAIVKAALQASGRSVAVVARSGLDLRRFDVRYSHAGISLRAGANGAWSVRELYYACDERRPRIFDEGMAGFVLGTDDPALGYLSAVLLPPGAAAAALERAALDDRQALALLGAAYSANAHAWADRYQNCNQWVAELLAAAWAAGAAAAPADAADAADTADTADTADAAASADAADADATLAAPSAAVQSASPRQPGAAADVAAAAGRPGAAPGEAGWRGAVNAGRPDSERRRAQRWLQRNGYAPSVFDVGSPALVWLAGALPYLHSDDHPADDLRNSRFRISMPASIDAFVRSTVPGAERIEFCHTAHRVVVRHGWHPIADGCTPADGDTVIVLD